jgi:predicted ATPase/DNA-binding CsgD family transcriptional regulator
MLPSHLAKVLSIAEEPGRPLLQSVASALENTQTLLILDNCEHLIDAIASLASELASSTPLLTILATSREPLRIPGEIELRVPPFRVPDPARLPPLADLLEEDVIRLFRDRAEAAQPRFAVTRANAPLVVQLCRRLDGVPLAIELAAAHLRSISLDDLYKRIRDRASIPSASSRGAPQRLLSLRAAIDWSYELLPPDEKALFSRLAVFAGSWTTKAANKVSWVEHGDDEGRTFELLHQLVEKSLLTVDHTTSPERFRFLETIRDYALARLLESDDADRVFARHSEYFIELVQDAEAQFRGPSEPSAMDSIEQEYDNIIAVFLESTRRSGAVIGARLAASLYRFWFVRGYWDEGRRWLTEFCNPGAALEPVLQWKCHHGLGVIAKYQGDLGLARRSLEAAIDASRSFQLEVETALSSVQLAYLALDEDDLERAHTLFLECLAAAGTTNDKRTLAATLNGLGLTAFYRGDFAKALELYGSSLDVDRERGEIPGIAASLMNMGDALLSMGDLDAAQRRYEEFVEVTGGHEIRAGVPFLLEGLAGLSVACGEYERGLRLIGAARRVRASTGPNLPKPRERRLGQWLRQAYLGMGVEAAELVKAGGLLDIESLNKLVESCIGEDDGALETDGSNAFNNPAKLTPREIDVLRLLRSGNSARAISEQLVVTGRTARKHIERIYDKLRTTQVPDRNASQTGMNRTLALALAERLGYFDEAIVSMRTTELEAIVEKED